MGCGEAGEAFRGPGEVGGRLGVRASRVGSGGATRGARGGGARNRWTWSIAGGSWSTLVHVDLQAGE